MDYIWLLVIFLIGSGSLISYLNNKEVYELGIALLAALMLVLNIYKKFLSR